MGRVNLTSLLDDNAAALDTAPATIDPEAEARTPEPTPEQPTPQARATKPEAGERSTPAKPKKKSTTRTPHPKPAPQPPAAAELPPYLQLYRKEARLREDQLSELTVRSRQLNKQKHPDADRITDNTLIRVAVDLLLSRSSDLAGGDEAELRRSVGL